MIEFIALFLGMCAGLGLLGLAAGGYLRLRWWLRLPSAMRNSKPRDGGRGVLAKCHVDIDGGKDGKGHFGAQMLEWAPALGVWTARDVE